ncbi:MAG: trigger factor [Candidatus Kaelpia aquatica]|nr:trigger factor [Candidatus Kaelpia aquatica]
MKIKIKRITTVESDLEVYLDPKEVGALRKRVESDWQNKVAIPGYRKGKAPLEMVLAKHSVEIEKDIEESVVSLFYRKAMEASGVNPISAPALLSVEQGKKGEYKFTLKIEEAPKVKLSKYKNIKLNKKDTSVEDKDINKVLDDIKREKTQWLDVQRPSALEDVVVADVEMKPKDSDLDKKEALSLYLNEENLFPELLDNLKGLSSGEIKEFKLNVPDDYRDKKIAGKECDFKINVKGVKEKKEPELNDDFAKEFGNHSNIDDLKKVIREELQNHRTREAEVDLEENLISELIENSKMELPPQLLSRQVDVSAEDIAMRLLYRGFPKKDIETQKEMILKEAQREAQRELKVYFILKEIAQKEGIVISDQELREHLEALAKRQNSTLEELESNLKKDDGLENIKASLLRKKVIEFLKQHAEIVNIKNGGE